MNQAPLSPTRLLADAVGKRLTQVGALQGATFGFGVAAVLALRLLVYVPLAPASAAQRIGTESLLAVLAVAVGMTMGARRQRARNGSDHLAAAIESAVPTSRNLLRTALELEGAQAPRTDAAVVAVVRDRADALASQIDVRQIVPTTRASQRLATAASVWLACVVLAQLVPAGTVSRTANRAVGAVTQRAAISRVDVTVTPPGYTQQPPHAQREPQRVDALEGSTLTFRVAANADSLRIETADGVRTISRPARGDFTWTTSLDADGFVALTPYLALRGDTRLVALSAQRDGAPLVRISAPGKDLVVPTPDRTLDVHIDATDDVAMRTLQLNYTKVSGSGERFEFTEGTIPVQVSRSSSTQWTARASLALRPLLIEPGDLVVYRARATDARPGRQPVESDAFIAQLAEAGGVAALGFSMDPDEDRYAVSQQMVIQKTERLIAAQRTLAADTVKDRAAQIAVEQRRVRAEFVFMTGGEFEAGVVEGEEGGQQLDESAEAEGEQDLAAGRMVNRGRQALLTAIRAMSRASLALTENRLADALRAEKSALTNLQEAFARQRFLMRALSQREALDPARRHSGAFDSLARATVVVPAPERDDARDALRGILAALLRPGARDTELAMRVLQVRSARADATREQQRIAQWLTRAASNAGAATVLRDSAAAALTAWIADGAGNETAAVVAPLAAQRRALRGGGR